MQESLLAEVTKVTKLSEEGLRLKTQPTLPYSNPVLTKVANTDKTLLAQSLGDFGNRIKNFKEFYDTSHPQMNQIMSPLLGTKTYLELLDAIDITETAVNNKMTGLLGLMNTVFNSSTPVKTIYSSLLTAPVRMLRERVDREYARVAGSSNIDLDKGERVPKAPSDMVLFNPVGVANSTDWATAPATFENHVRLCNPEGAQTERFALWASRLKAMGMTSQADTYQRRVNEAKSRSLNTYCGFYKLSITEACAMLGKVHDYRCQIPFAKIVLGSDDPKIGSLFQLMMPSGSFAKTIHNFFGTKKSWDRTTSIADNIAHLRGGSFEDTANDIASLYEFMTAKHRINLFEYQPRLYPLHAFQILMPDRIKAMVDALEAFEDFGGKPLFDRYYVLVPGVTFEQSYFENDVSKKYHFRSKDKTIELSNKDEAYFLMDSFLMKRGMVYPIVLGKKDNDQYFLTYWDV